jgi:hypothetical protein
LKSKIEISATIVLYKNDLKILQKTIDCFLKIPFTKKLYLLDNSPTNKLHKEFNNPEIEYKFIGKNIGFGKAHNLVLNQIKNLSNFHLALNPDVIFKPEEMSALIDQLKKSKEIALVSPKVIYPNGESQFTCRKHPTFLELIYRRLGIFKTFTKKQEYRNQDLSKPFYPDFVHGCFMLFKTEDFIRVNGFDERYFMYFEDADICRELAQQQKKILYYPDVVIEHEHAKGSAKKLNLLFHHLSSAIKYYKKWKN